MCGNLEISTMFHQNNQDHRDVIDIILRDNVFRVYRSPKTLPSVWEVLETSFTKKSPHIFQILRVATYIHRFFLQTDLFGSIFLTSYKYRTVKLSKWDMGKYWPYGRVCLSVDYHTASKTKTSTTKGFLTVLALRKTSSPHFVLTKSYSLPMTWWSNKHSTPYRQGFQLATSSIQ